MSYIARRSRLYIAAMAGTICLAGCATGPTVYEKRQLTPDQQSVVSNKPAALKPLYRELFQEGRRNEVLNLMEIGARAFREKEYDIAETVFDRVILNIESVYADNEAAQKARSLWYEEGEKDFKGEPYERSMAYLYRGLLFLIDGDYGNARASFLSGLLQDAFAEEEQHTSDFASLVYLAGWAAKLDGNDKLAKEHFEEYRQFRPDGPVPKKAHNVLVMAETGKSPRKLADGVGHYELVYRRGKNFEESRVKLSGSNGSSSLYPVEDVYFQASTRGGRTIDRIIEGQVKFKKTSSRVGSTLTAPSKSNTVTALATSSGGGVASGFQAITAIGVVAQGLSASARTRADTRYWKRLPDTLHVSTMRVNDKNNNFDVNFYDANGRLLERLGTTADIEYDKNGNGVIYVSSRPNR